MRFPLWAHPTNAPSRTTANFISPEGIMAWNTIVTGTGRLPVPPGGGTVKEFDIALAAAPGVGKSWTFSYVVNGVEVESTRVKIEGEAKTGKWTGTLKLNEGDTLLIKITPAGEPAVPGIGTEGTAFYTWVETTGNIFWVAGGGGGNIPLLNGSSNPPFGMNSAGWHEEGEYHVIVPGKFKVKGLAVLLNGSPGAGKYYEFQTSGGLVLKIEGTATSGLVAGSGALTTGQQMAVSVNPSFEPSPTQRSAGYCMAIESEANGEMCAMGMNIAASSTTAARVSYPDTFRSTWGTLDTTNLKRPAGLKFERLYVQIAVAPGEGKSRTLALRMNNVTQALAAKIEGAAATTANDTTHSFTTDGSNMEFITTPSGTPNIDTDSHWGFVVIVPQPKAGAASVSGTSSVKVGGRRRRTSGAKPSGNSFLSDKGVRRRFGGGAVSGKGSAAVGVARRRRHGAITAAGNSFLSDKGVRRRFGGGAASAAADSMANGTRRHYGGGTATGNSYMSDKGVRRRFGGATVAGTSDASAVGARRYFGAAAVSGLGSALLALVRLFTVPGNADLKDRSAAATLSDKAVAGATSGDTGVGLATTEDHPVLSEEA